MEANTIERVLRIPDHPGIDIATAKPKGLCKLAARLSVTQVFAISLQRPKVFEKVRAALTEDMQRVYKVSEVTATADSNLLREIFETSIGQLQSSEAWAAWFIARRSGLL